MFSSLISSLISDHRADVERDRIVTAVVRSTSAPTPSLVSDLSARITR